MSHNNYFSGVKNAVVAPLILKNKKTASGARPEAVKFTLLLSQGRRFISSAIAAAS
ncbi:hypothetical protein LTSEURB_1556 [Salmonella enterica subsp. enterica serovar Urbana str. R8-2977]|uniref:Uncharacterized protein n=1 Tax=Salmonella enterica subsp. enterica serovar Urbana str. R8-2977 TaxID=913084 RepID=G5RTE2_SALET|nr:hypothetical protein LTSEURB_1556 [Salmonella enterica subsp. enterica serovar Urbana str. R8-2977]